MHVVSTRTGALLVWSQWRIWFGEFWNQTIKCLAYFLFANIKLKAKVKITSNQFFTNRFSISCKRFLIWSWEITCWLVDGWTFDYSLWDPVMPLLQLHIFIMSSSLRLRHLIQMIPSLVLTNVTVQNRPLMIGFCPPSLFITAVLTTVVPAVTCLMSLMNNLCLLQEDVVHTRHVRLKTASSAAHLYFVLISLSKQLSGLITISFL